MHSQSIIPVLLIILLVAVLSFFLYTTTMNLTSEQLQYEPILPKPQIDSVFQDEENRLCITFFNPNDVNYTLTSPLILRRNDIEITTDINVVLPPGTSIHCVEVNIPSSGSYSLSLPSEAIIFPTPPLLSNTPSLSAPSSSPSPPATFSVTTCPYTCPYPSRMVSKLYEVNVYFLPLDISPDGNRLLVMLHPFTGSATGVRTVVVNVSNMGNPVTYLDLNGYSWSFTTSMRDVFIDDNRIALVDQNQDLVVLNISSTPFVEGKYESNTIIIAYVESAPAHKVVFMFDPLGADSNLYLIDVSNPSSPTLLTAYSPVDLNISAINDFLFVDEVNVAVILSSPTPPVTNLYFYSFVPPSSLFLISSLEFNAADPYISEFIPEDNLLVVVDANGFRLIDISNLSSPSIVYEINSISGIMHVYPIFGKNALVISRKGENNTVYVDIFNYKLNIPENSFRFIPSNTLSDFPFFVALHDNRFDVFFVGGPESLYILSLCGVPKYLSKLSNGLVDIEVWREKQVAFVQGSGIEVYDISDPYNPSLLSTIPLSGVPYLLEEKNLLVSFAGTVTLVDITNPSTPQILSSITTNGGLIYYEGTILPELNLLVTYDYTATGTPRVLVYNISNPSAPVHEANIELTVSFGDPVNIFGIVGVPEHNVAVVIANTGLFALDLTNLPNITTVGSLPIPMGQVWLDYMPKKKLLVISTDFETYFVDVSNPASMQIVGITGKSQYPMSLEEINIITLYEGVTPTFRTYNISFLPYLIPEEPILMGSASITKNTFDTNKFLAYASYGVINVCGYPRTRSIFPKDVNYYAIPFWSPENNRVYIYHVDDNLSTANDRLEVWDISSLSSPVKLGELNNITIPPAQLYSQGTILLYDENRVFVPDANVLRLINFSNPSNPFEEWNIVVSSYINGVFYVPLWKKVFVGTSTGIVTVDVSNIAAPQLLGNFGGASVPFIIYDTILDFNTLILLELNGGTFVITLRYYQDANNLLLLSYIDLNSNVTPYYLDYIREKNMIVMVDANSLMVVDVTNLLAPSILWEQNIIGSTGAIYLPEQNNVMVFVGDRYGLYNVDSITDLFILEEKNAELGGLGGGFKVLSRGPNTNWIFVSSVLSNFSFLLDVTLYDGWNP